MPVIGRLDEQVHEVLIEPVSKRRRGEERPDERPRERRDEPDERPRRRKPSEDESPGGRGELPVWML